MGVSILYHRFGIPRRQTLKNIYNQNLEDKKRRGYLLLRFHLLITKEAKDGHNSYQSHDTQNGPSVAQLSRRIKQERFCVVKNKPCWFTHVGFCCLKAIQQDRRNRQRDQANCKGKGDINPCITASRFHTLHLTMVYIVYSLV